MKLVNGKEIVFCEMNDNIVVIAGGELLAFKWAEIVNGVGYVTLEGLQKQFEENYTCFMVIAESPLDGAIYRFNNYGENEWYKVGTMCGYA